MVPVTYLITTFLVSASASSYFLSLMVIVDSGITYIILMRICFSV